jgi:hypothetical protein
MGPLGSNLSKHPTNKNKDHLYRPFFALQWHFQGQNAIAVSMLPQYKALPTLRYFSVPAPETQSRFRFDDQFSPASDCSFGRSVGNVFACQHLAYIGSYQLSADEKLEHRLRKWNLSE